MKVLIIVLIASIQSFTLNFDPLPKSFTETIRISPQYKYLRLTDLDISSAGGTASDELNGFGIGLSWGAPFKGFEFVYDNISNDFISSSGSIITNTSIAYDSLKLRFYLPFIDDYSSTFNFFFSAGRYGSLYTINKYTEAAGQSSYIERYQTGYVFDVGLVLGYQLNKQWHLFLSSTYQFSELSDITDPLGDSSSDPFIDFRGASIEFGTVLNL